MCTSEDGICERWSALFRFVSVFCTRRSCKFRRVAFTRSPPLRVRMEERRKTSEYLRWRCSLWRDIPTSTLSSSSVTSSSSLKQWVCIARCGRVKDLSSRKRWKPSLRSHAASCALGIDLLVVQSGVLFAFCFLLRLLLLCFCASSDAELKECVHFWNDYQIVKKTERWSWWLMSKRLWVTSLTLSFTRARSRTTCQSTACCTNILYNAGVLSDIWKRSASIFVMQSSVGVLSNVFEIHSDRVKVWNQDDDHSFVYYILEVVIIVRRLH